MWWRSIPVPASAVLNPPPTMDESGMGKGGTRLRHRLLEGPPRVNTKFQLLHLERRAHEFGSVDGLGVLVREACRVVRLDVHAGG
ncbi:hypothetical protein KSP40_PGU002403 [Platanthera guangdongensis]|uniref:Uncharacterized protein n=1 Tax=Platanthera guangdongensis TaxID=2320717 RepID=A0ABR2MCA9_9ASPA